VAIYFKIFNDNINIDENSYLYLYTSLNKSPCECIDSARSSRVLSPFHGGAGLRTSLTRTALLAGMFMLRVGPSKSDRLKVRGQAK